MQAAVESLGSAWQAVEPLGGGVLSTSLDVDALARVARERQGAGRGGHVLMLSRAVFLDGGSFGLGATSLHIHTPGAHPHPR